MWLTERTIDRKIRATVFAKKFPKNTTDNLVSILLPDQLLSASFIVCLSLQGYPTHPDNDDSSDEQTVIPTVWHTQSKSLFVSRLSHLSSWHDG